MVRVRRSFRDLEKEYFTAQKNGSKELTMLERVVKAFIGLSTQYKPDDWNSFYTIGGLHGEPFRGAGWGSSAWWGGYCNHGNILFPTWHRAYLMRIETALITIDKGDDFALPFWDEIESTSLKEGIPSTFGQPTFTYLTNGQTVTNPLYSYQFAKGIWDNIATDDHLYTKPKGYQTVRYPKSGLVGTDKAREATEAINKKWPEPQAFAALNQNVVNWLTMNNMQTSDTNTWIAALNTKYQRCLQAVNYTVFSNTTSAAAYNESNFEEGGWNPNKPGDPAVVPLEDPHNGMHLAIGGFDVPGQGNFDQSPGANGDMGENDTAGLDPIFYFHHCWIDLTFHKWQKLHGQEKEIFMDPKYARFPGTNSVDGQNPTPGVAGNTWLSLDSPLAPFTKADDGNILDEFITSKDVISIQDLGYEYGPNSLDIYTGLDDVVKGLGAETQKGLHYAKITGVNRGDISGSFIISARAVKSDGQEELVGVVPVLSRWHTQGCKNCQNHLNVTAFVPVNANLLGSGAPQDLTAVTHTRQDIAGMTPANNPKPLVLGQIRS